MLVPLKPLRDRIESLDASMVRLRGKTANDPDLLAVLSELRDIVYELTDGQWFEDSEDMQSP